jgi:dimethylargininase
VPAIGAALGPWFPEPDAITAPATLDGGDVCEAGQHFFIGRGARTNAEGAEQLAGWLEQRGFGSSVIDIRPMPSLLHLKTGLSWLGGRRLLAADEVAGHEALGGWEVVRAPAGEEYAANCLWINGTVLIPQGCPETAALLVGLGYVVTSLEMSEYRKMDGGLSCLSVRW